MNELKLHMKNIDKSNIIPANKKENLSAEKVEEMLKPPGKLSLNNNMWVIKNNKEATDFIDNIIINRNVNKENFLKRSIKDFWPTEGEIPDLEKALQICSKYLIHKHKIGIIGDYDVDGTSGTCILYKFLSSYSPDNIFYQIPNRFKDGYGATVSIVESLAEKGVKLIITVDNGSTAYDAINKCKELGIETIILDHHAIQESIDADAFVNPHRYKDNKFHYLCATGLTFIFIWELKNYMKKIGYTSYIQPLDFLDKVAIATICDVVPLVDLNRGLVYHGMQKLNNKPSKCFFYLLKDNLGKIDENKIAFFLSPYINVAGRFGDGMLTVKFLCSEDDIEINSIIYRLTQLTLERREIEKKIIEECEDNGNKVLVFAKEGWHEGVLGIVAGRLKDKFYKPVIVLTFDGEKYKGSVRSVDGFNVGEFISKGIEKSLIKHGGGHRLAGGLLIEKHKFDEFLKFTEEYSESCVIEAYKTITVDSYISLLSVNEKTFDKIKTLFPYGNSNSEPVFLIPDCRITFIKQLEKNTFIIRVSNGMMTNEVSGLIFNMPEDKAEVLYDSRNKFNMVVNIKKHNTKGNIQINILDLSTTDDCIIDNDKFEIKKEGRYHEI
jgi:single-stranded-DNA-specific exonuclease